MESTLTETVQKKRRYSELLSNLDICLPSLVEQVDGLADRMLPGLCPRDQLDWLDVLAGEAAARSTDVDDLAAAGEELVAILTELDCSDTPKAREIAAEVDRSRKQLGEIFTAIGVKRTALEVALARLMEANAGLASALKWMDDAEARASTLFARGASLDRVTLVAQITEHRAFAADVTAYAPNVGTVAERCASVWIEGRVTELQERHHALVKSLDEHDGRLDVIRRRLNAVHDGISSLDRWIAGTVGAIGRRSVDLEQLCATRQAKRRELDAVTSAGRELTNDELTTDRHRLRDALSDLRSRWRELMQLLVNTVSNAATLELDELTKFVSKAQDSVNLVVPINADPENVIKQLAAHKAFHEELYAKRDVVDRTMARCRRMLQESPSDEETSVDVDIRLSTLRDQIDSVCRLSDRRLLILGELIPLVSHLSQIQLEMRAWLCDVRADVDALDPAGDLTPDGEDRAEHLRAMLQMIDDHQSVVDELTNTGQEIVSLCSDICDPARCSQLVDDLCSQYEALKQTTRQRLADQEELYKQIFTDAADNLSMLLETTRNLNDKVSYSDDEPTLNVKIIRQLIAENNEILDDLERVSSTVQDISTVMSHLPEATCSEDEKDDKYADLESRLHDVAALHASAVARCQERSSSLRAALDVAQLLHNGIDDISTELSRIRDICGSSHGVLNADPGTVRQQLLQLQELENDVQAVSSQIADFRLESEGLVTVETASEMQKYISELEDALEEVTESLKRRLAELEADLERADSYSTYYEAVMKWLPGAEAKIKSMALIATNPRSVRIQIEEFKVFRVQMGKWQSDVHNLNQFVAELKRTSSQSVTSSLSPCVGEVNERWNKLLVEANEREADMRGALIELGEVEHAIEDVMGLLHQIESDLQQFGEVYGDPRHIEVHLRKIQILLKELSSQKGIISKLEDTIDVLVKRSGRTWSPLADRHQEMVSMFIDVQASARERRDELLDRLNEVKGFVSSADDLMKWLDDFRRKLQWCAPLGALPDSARVQLNKLMDAYRELEGKEMEVMAMMLNGEDMFVRCRDHEAQLLRRKLIQLKASLNDTKAKADKIKLKMESHVNSVEVFHNALATQSTWLSAAEKTLRTFKKPSKLYEGVQSQIRSLKALRADIELRGAEMKNVDHTGTYLKYFGSKQDTVYVRNRLASTRLRWKRLLRRADEMSRSLDKALRDAKRFYDLWKSLYDWLEISEDNLQKFVIDVGVRTKQDMDELRRFESQLSSRQPSYCTTRRLGATLCNRCAKNDSEHEQLAEMLNLLVTKWNKMRSIASHRLQKSFDSSSPMTSDNVDETVDSLLLWLSTAESYLAESRPLLGDVDTVNMLMQQHQDFQQELLRRMELAQRILDNTSDTTNQSDSSKLKLENLTSATSRIQRLTETRQMKLHEALKLAEDFSDAVEAVNEWLPLAEAELKFRALPEEEDGLIRWIENHEKFDEELRAQEPDIERLTYIGEEMLVSCHRSAERYIRYQLTVMQSRWQQSVRRSKLRTTRLHEALHEMRHSATRCEDLESWLAQMHALLTSRDGHTIPHDEIAIESLLTEHNRLHQELIGRRSELEKLIAFSSPLSHSHISPSRVPHVAHTHANTLPTPHSQSWTTASYSSSRSRTPPGTLNRSRTPPVVIATRSRTPPVVIPPRSRTPPVVIPPRSRTPPGTIIPPRSHTPPSTLASRSRTPPVQIVSSTRSRTPPGSIPRSHTPPTASSRRSPTPPGSTSRSQTSSRTRVPSGSPQRRELPAVPGETSETSASRRSCSALWERYRLLLELSGTRRKRLDDALNRQKERKVCESFDFNEWRKRCADWLRSRRLRAADLFRLQDRSGNGVLSRKQFVDAMLAIKLPSSYAELNAVFDVYDVTLTGHINYRELLKSIDRQSVVSRLCGEPASVVSDSEFIHDEIRQQQRRCICPSRFPVQKVDDGKYKFGDRGKLCLVRFVNSSVTVRVGGGWKTLEEFFDSNDPCRLHYRPTRGGQMTPPDVVARCRDDQFSSSRPAWNQASLSMRISASSSSASDKSRNHSFSTPRWHAPTLESPTSFHPVGRPVFPGGDGGHFGTRHPTTADARPTATWPRTPKPAKTPTSGHGSPLSTRKNVKAAEPGNGSKESRHPPPPSLMKRSM